MDIFPPAQQNLNIYLIIPSQLPIYNINVVKLVAYMAGSAKTMM